MKALVYTAPETLALKEMPQPESKADEAIVKVEYVGICGSDMHAYLGHDERRPAPLILGHEAAGIIQDGSRQGERVTVNPLVTCGTCAACLRGQNNLCARREIISMPPREGAFAEYIQVPSKNLVHVPDHVPLEKAALAEPIACGWNAVKQLKRYMGDLFPNACALVIGGGAIGVGAALSLKAQGVDDITLIEPHEAKASYLRDELKFNVKHPDDVSGLDHFDMAIDGVGFEATRALVSQQVRPGGAIAHIGLGTGVGGLDIRRMTLQEIAFFGTYTYTSQDFRETAQAIFAGQMGDLDWIDIRSLEDGAQAFHDIKLGQSLKPKIILQP